MWSRVYATVGRPSVSGAAGLLLSARRAGDIDRLLHAGARQQPRRSTERSSKCEQCHFYT